MNIENIKKVRDHIASLPPERFDMSLLAGFRARRRGREPIGRTILHNCGTAACIAGWTCALLGNRMERPDTISAEDLLGLGSRTAQRLFLPDGWGGERVYTQAQAIATLDRLIATGDVIWPKAA